MGYYTRYDFEVKANYKYDFIGDFRSHDADSSYAFDENGVSIDTTRWYTHESDVKLFSLKHPDALFILYGNGEEEGDMWKKYFKNGKMQVVKAIITYPEFDKELLK